MKPSLNIAQNSIYSHYTTFLVQVYGGHVAKQSKAIHILEEQIAIGRQRLQNLYDARGQTDNDVLAASIELNDPMNQYPLKLSMEEVNSPLHAKAGFMPLGFLVPSCKGLFIYIKRDDIIIPKNKPKPFLASVHFYNIHLLSLYLKQHLMRPLCPYS